MPITFTTTQAGASPDYEKYLMERPQKTARYKDSTLLDFSLAPVDTAFVKLTRGAYITLDSTTYPKWFTGYVINDPELTYLGVDKNGAPAWGYKYQATSDEYILSLKPLGIVPPFLNVTMGQIIKSLADRLLPGMFDVTGVDDGPLVAQYVVDPNKKFLEVVQEFCESASFTFWGNDHKLYFMAQDSSTLGSITLDGNSPHFTPARLQIKPASSSTNVLNDVVVLGQVEPQAYVTEYFVGTGLDASFPLISSVFGADASVLLDDTFSGANLDGSKWSVFDVPSNFIQVANGYVNVLGGNGVGNFGIRIQSVSPVGLDSRVRFTHGDWRLTSGKGIIAGLWTTTPNASYTGCVYALRVDGTTIKPIVNGVLDTTQAITDLDPAKRYVIRTVVEFSKANRLSQAYNYLNSSGAVASVGGTSTADDATWTTLISEVSLTDGSVTRQFTFTNTAAVSDSYATYVPVASETLDCAFTGVTISIPVAATLELATKVPMKNLDFEDWDTPSLPSDWATAHGAYQETLYSDDPPDGVSLKLDPPSNLEEAYVEQAVTEYFEAGKTYKIVARVKKHVTSTPGASVQFRLYGTGVAQNFTVGIASLSSSDFIVFTGDLLTTAMTSVPADLKFRVSLLNSNQYDPVWVDNIVVMSDWASKLVGPNEIDGLDGQAPVATIVSGNLGAETRNSYLGVPQYNPGQSQLVFFKNSLTQTSDTPPENQVIRLSYRAAGPALGRAINRASIEAEFSRWQDDGIRSAVRTDVVPRPRNSQECELAAAAIVNENSAAHYEGAYEQWSPYFDKEPKPGMIFRFTNLSNMAPVDWEEINQVTTVLEHKATEYFRHTLSFGKPDTARRLFSQFAAPKGSFQKSADNVNVAGVDVGAVAAAGGFATDITAPRVLYWNDSNVAIDSGETLTASDYLEVRYTDEGWGVDDGINLVTRTQSSTFIIPRNLRGRVFFMRKASVRNYCLNSEDQTQASYTKSGVTVTKELGQNPDGGQSTICVGTFSSGGYIETSLTGMSGSSFCASVSVKGTAGKALTLNLGGTTKAVTLTGQWQRVSVARSGTAPSAFRVTFSGSGSTTVYMTRFSVEQGTSVETAYAKTTSIKYGPVSRYSAAMHVNFPATTTTSEEVAATLLRPTY
jgi:glycine cleavage system regulatory protein